MIKNNFNVNMRMQASYATGVNYLNNDFHKHKVYEIFVMLESEAKYYVEDTIYHLKRGDVLIINSEEMHKFPNQDNMTFSRLTVIFDPDIFRGLSTPQTDILYCFNSRKPGENNLIHLDNVEFNEFLSLSDKIISLYNQHNYGCDILMLSYMLKLLILLNQKYMSINISMSDTIPIQVKPILEYIDKHLIDDLSLDTISSALKMDKIHINKLMKKYTGYTIHKYVNIRRISSAKALISTGFSATDACFLSGFNDYTSFARIFKSITGFNPRDYKNR